MDWLYARLLAEVPSTSIEYCEVYKILRIIGFQWVPGSPGPGSTVFLTTHLLVYKGTKLQHSMEYKAHFSPLNLDGIIH